MEAIALLLERGIPVSFLTKGEIPGELYPLLARYRPLVRAQVGLVSVDSAYQRTFEPGAAPPAVRLENLRRLRAAGIPVEARVDPVIPGLTDGDAAAHRLFAALAGAGVSQAILSFLILRPAIWSQLISELPPGLAHRLRDHFLGGPVTRVAASERTWLPRRSYREEAYHRLCAIAAGYGIATRLCACKNPDLADLAISPCLPSPGPAQLPLLRVA